jgi:hypothetical protein
MIEIIALIILLGSFVGMGVIVYRKIPVLIALPIRGNAIPRIFGSLKYRIKNNEAIKSFSVETILQRYLSKIMVFVLKIENKIGEWLMKLRQKNIQKKTKFSNDYWQKIMKKK